MTEIYFVEQAGLCVQRTVELSYTPCVEVENYTDPDGNIFITYKQDLVFTIPTPLDVDLNVRMLYKWVEEDNFGNTWETWVLITETIDAGQTSVSRTVVCQEFSQIDAGAGGIITEQAGITEYKILPQQTIPEVCLDPECDLVIDNVIVTNPELRGETGEVSIDVEGYVWDEPITFYLNGILFKTHTPVWDGGGSPPPTPPTLTITIEDVPSQTYLLRIIQEECFDETTFTVLEGEFRTGDFVITQPSQVTAAYNPIIGTVRTAQANFVGRKARIVFEVEDMEIPDGYRIVFNLTSPFNYVQTFYARGFPNKRNYFLSSKILDTEGNEIGINTRSEITHSIAEVFWNDVIISQNYDVSVSGNKITLQAKREGSRFDLSSSNVFIRDEDNVDTNEGIVIDSTISGINKYDGQIVDDYSVVADVYVNTSPNIFYPSLGSDLSYEKVTELSMPFQDSNRHVFDFSDVLQNYVSTPKPFYEFTGHTIQPTMMRPFFIKYYENYPLVSNQPTSKKRFKTETSKRWFINSSLSLFDNNDMNDYVELPKKFLTTSPNPKRIQRNQNEYLYIILEGGSYTPAKCVGDIYYYDGTSDLGVDFFDIFTVGQFVSTAGGVFMLNLSYDKLGLEDFEHQGGDVKKIKFVDVRVVYGEGEDDLSETKRYSFNINEQDRKFGVLFQNSLGTFDTFDFIGVVEKQVNRETGEFVMPTQPTNTGRLRQGFKHNAVYDTKITKQITCNSGYLDRTHYNWLMEILQSNEIYNYTEDNQHFLKIVNYSFIESSQEDLFDLEVTFQHTIYKNNVNV